MNFQEVFKCVICTIDYDKKMRQPMMICQNYHTICRMCLYDICKDDKAYECPICRVKISRGSAIYNGSFFQYRDEATQLHFQKVKLQHKKKQMIRKLQIFQQKISFDAGFQVQQKQKTRNIKSYKEQIQKLQNKIDDYADFQLKLQNYIDQIEAECKDLKKQLERIEQQNEKLDHQMQLMTNIKTQKQWLQEQNSRQERKLIENIKINKDIQEKLKYFEDENDDLKKKLQKVNCQYDQYFYQHKRKSKNFKEEKLQLMKTIQNFKKSQQQSQRVVRQLQQRIVRQVQELKYHYQTIQFERQMFFNEHIKIVQQLSRNTEQINSENNQLKIQLAGMNRQKQELAKKLKQVEIQIQSTNLKGQKLRAQNTGLKEINRTNILQMSYLKKRNINLIRLKNELQRIIKQSQSTCNCKKHTQPKQQSTQQYYFYC